MAIEKDFFRQVMGSFVTGVTVVTTGSQGRVAGLTVNAFCSVSLDPALVLICVDLTSTTLPLIRESNVFAINILTEEQEHLSRCFAGYSKERSDHFCHASYGTAVTGAPILDAALAFVDARIVAEYPGGDHVIFLGLVVALGQAGRTLFADEADRQGSLFSEESKAFSSQEPAASPLVYYRGQYSHLAPTSQRQGQSALPPDTTADSSSPAH